MAVDRALMPSLLGGQPLEVPVPDMNEPTVVQLPDGGVELHLRLNELSAVSKWILGFGSSATVLAPVELQQLVRAEATAMLQDLDDLSRGGE